MSEIQKFDNAIPQSEGIRLEQAGCLNLILISLPDLSVATVVAEDVVASFSEVGVAFGVAASFADVAVTAVVVVVAVAELVVVDEE